MSRRILVADDDPLMRTFIVVSIGSAGETTEAVDGDEALTLLEQDSFDLALIDWDMPGRNGLDVIRTIRAKGSQVPIIMVTGKAEREQVVQALEAGVSDYLIKPFESSALRKKLDKLR